MRRLVLATVLTLAFGLVSPSLHAQTLEAGAWFGSMQPPDTPEPVRISYEVSHEGEGMWIVAMGGENSLELNEARFEDGNLVYWFQTGPRVDCVLHPTGKDTYAGDCSDTEGATGQMMITRDESRVKGMKTVAEMEGAGHHDDDDEEHDDDHDDHDDYDDDDGGDDDD
jgi:hypothetical protein